MIANYRRPLLCAFLTLAIAASVLASCAQAGPFSVYLTYPGDPSTTITVNFQTSKQDRETEVYIDTVPRRGHKEAYARRVEGASTSIPGLPVPRTIHYATLDGLTADTTYFFIAGNDSAGFSREQSFRTIPAGDGPLRFVAGGDMDATRLTRKLLKVAARQNPQFAIVGGDIAYANGDVKNYRKWDRWFANWDRYMRTSEGHRVPIVAAIGNHETNKAESEEYAERAPFYHAYFGRQADATYFDRTFGSLLALVVLDSGHIATHDGEQKTWLAEALARHVDVPYRFAVYHVPLYPSHRDFDGELSASGRTHWGPLFDEHRLTTAFENHDHTLKRTKLIKNNEVSPEGTLYLGDGSWGVKPREVDKDRRWYEEFAAGKGHVWIVDVSAQGVTYRALGVRGKVLDSAETPAPSRP
ncbi:MAG: metallophosphoesterase family protein [Candidatus Hydrogenedentes bacterium]|nr:metallophosphoesterase family protein [Candidatus Hydrogenedentota bacterium]